MFTVIESDSGCAMPLSAIPTHDLESMRDDGIVPLAAMTGIDVLNTIFQEIGFELWRRRSERHAVYKGVRL